MVWHLIRPSDGELDVMYASWWIDFAVDAAIVSWCVLLMFAGAIRAYFKSREDVRRFHRMANGEDE